jgi:hypothetical protein
LKKKSSDTSDGFVGFEIAETLLVHILTAVSAAVRTIEEETSGGIDGMLLYGRLYLVSNSRNIVS